MTLRQGASTRVVAGQMRQRRQAAGWSAAKLAEEVARVGVPWKREIVANLESGRRAQLDVSELLALAVVFDVPPIALLVDPAANTVAVTPEIDAPLHDAVLWLLAEAPLAAAGGAQRRPSGSWIDAQHPIGLVRWWHAAVVRCQVQIDDLETNARLAAQGQDVADRLTTHEQWLGKGLQELRRVRAEMRAVGMRLPQVPGAIAAAAAERSYKLEED